MIASEGQNLERKAGKLRHDLFPEAYGLTPDDTIFFSVQAKEDVYHVQEGLDLVSDICTNTKEPLNKSESSAIRPLLRLSLLGFPKAAEL